MDNAAAMRAGAPPLEGLRVVELGTVVAGPYAASLLADLGADVIKVEPPGQGDVLRRVGPSRDDVHVWWGVSSRNKRCVGVDLKSEEGAGHFRRLLQDADILVSNYRPGALVKLGFGPNELAALNANLVHVTISGYGAPGPKSRLPGFGKIAEGVSGLVNLTGHPDETPLFCGFSLGDTSTGLFAALGAIFALYGRDRVDGRGSLVDVALYEALMRATETQFADAQAMGESPTRRGTNYPYGGGRDAQWPRIVTTRTKDGDWIAIYSPGETAAKQCEAIFGAEANAKSWDEALRSWCASRSAEDARDALAAFSLEVAPVLDGQSLARNAYIKTRGDVLHVRDDVLGELAVPGHVDPISASSARAFHMASLDDPSAVQWNAPRIDISAHAEKSGGALFSELAIVEISDTPGASFAATLFADYGATVHVLERVDDGSSLRRLSPNLWTSLGRNKHSVAIGPRQDPLVKALLERADIVFTDVPRRQWADHAWLSSLPQENRGAMAAIFPTGADRPDLWPWSTHPALSAAASGIMAITGWDEDSPPVQAEAPLADYCAGALAALRVAAALWRGTARNLVVEEPIHRALLRMIEWQCPVASIVGRPPLRQGNGFPMNMGIGSLCRSKDGKYISISAVSDKTVARLLYLIGGDALLHDPRFASAEARTRHGPEAYDKIVEWVARLSAREVIEIAVANDVVMGIIWDAQAICADSHIQARASVVDVRDGGHYVAVSAITPRVGDWVVPIRTLGPALGSANAAVERLLPNTRLDG
jgi:crotonobetainyl-CoA:carnitine CoA-transferase CaiB-like acyl-CoA transferase